jgi:chromosome segregation ATPase
MAGIVRTAVRIGVITALVGGAAVVVAGPQRSWAFLHQTRGKIHSCIDSNIKDPVALRAQLRDLEAQYPKRIGAVKGDLAEVQTQIGQLERDLSVSRRVVALADTDLTQMQGVLAKAEETRQAGNYAIVKVRFGDQSMPVDEAYTKANRVGQLRSAYVSKVADIERDLGYLGQQRERLARLLEKLEKERAEFQAQLFNLDRQVDTIARNERLIDMLKDRQRTIDEHSRYQAASLDQITGRLADIRARQESQLDVFGQNTDMENYEDQAKYQLDVEHSNPLALPRKPVTSPTVIEIGPEDVEPETGSGQIATRGGGG